tara:strand:- start:259 stop:828 length:570 start_codon:yes stop_codon:yes gene_type:complete
VSEKSNFFSTRRSVLARKMSNAEIPEDHLDLILKAGIRVPDHGALNPWKIKVIKGESLRDIDENIILKEFLKQNPKADDTLIKRESTRLQRASVVIAVISTPVEHFKITEWEMRLSSGAVCMNLLSSSQSLNYAAQWLTEWYAYNDNLIKFLGGDPKKDKIAGFIYIGHKKEEPVERKRPDPNNIITFI